ncbi:MAG: efflux RND transporter periplasmic adaptor subunit [Rubritalea sp.]|uniref:efflux RND transporter periplasmic adaptor subunit n=1 Tax=Rubritalea sp. TaxID=2109375 RepID=UPI003242C719
MITKRFILPLITAASSLTFIGCGPKNEFTPPPPVPVTVAKPIVNDQTVYKNFPATLAGVSEIEIRARVRGILEKSYFEEGSVISKGSDLFQIEQAPYLASVAAAEADVAKTEAALRISNATLGRLKKAGSGAVSELDIETAQAEVDNAVALVAESKARLEAAQIDLSYTSIKSPINGRVARCMVDAGNLVGNGDPTLLTSVVDEESIRAYYEVPERVMLEYYRRRSEVSNISHQLNKVRLELADGTIYDHLGMIDFIDNKVNETTRTAQVRAVFPNAEGMLSSGLFARVGYPKNYKDAIMVPAVSIMKDIGGSFVWVVDTKNKVHRRGVVTGDTVLRKQVDENAVPVRDTIITKGLTKDDSVIISGLQRVREGAIVTPEMSSSTGTSAVEQPAELKAKHEESKQS